MTEPLLEKLASRVVTPDRAMALFGALFFDSPDAVIIVNASEQEQGESGKPMRGEILLVNKRAVYFTRYTAEELIGEYIRMLLPAGIEDRHEAHMDGFHDDPHFRRMGENLDLKIRCKGGIERPVLITLSPVQMEEGLWVILHIRELKTAKSG